MRRGRAAQPRRPRPARLPGPRRRRAGRARKLLLATGVIDHLPDIPGFEPLYGRSVHHCPYCDGWEHRDQPLAAYGTGESAVSLARALLTWSRDVVLCTNGQDGLSAEDRAELARYRVPVREQPIARLEGEDGRLQRIVFAHGDPLARAAMFFHDGQHTRLRLAVTLGCAFTAQGFIEVDAQEMTCVAGLYVAGDASHDVQLAVIAAAEGARAAFAINKALLHEDLAMAQPALPAQPALSALPVSSPLARPSGPAEARQPGSG